MKSDKHHENLNESHVHSSKVVAKNTAAGMIVGKLAYAAIKMEHNVSRFEDLVALEASKGAEVGDINHGKDFARGFRNSVYQKLFDQLRNDIAEPLRSTGSPAPISVIADKMTPDRRTGQMVAIIMHHNGRLKDFNVDFSRIGTEHYTGSGLAGSICSSLRKIVPSGQNLR